MPGTRRARRRVKLGAVQQLGKLKQTQCGPSSAALNAQVTVGLLVA